MTSIQVADDTFVAASPLAVRSVLVDRAHWRRWWPDLSLTVVEDRAEQGIRWTVTGGLDGTMEVWCEPVLDGFVLHYFLHAEPRETLPSATRALGDRLARLNHQRRVAGRLMSTEVKNRLESGRAIGEPAQRRE